MFQLIHFAAADNMHVALQEGRVSYKLSDTKEKLPPSQTTVYLN